MYGIIERYIQKLTKDDINSFAIKNNINLSEEELDFSYIFVKKNYKEVLGNPDLLILDRYKEKFSEENFNKIKKLFIAYRNKYQMFL